MVRSHWIFLSWCSPIFWSFYHTQTWILEDWRWDGCSVANSDWVKIAKRCEFWRKNSPNLKIAKFGRFSIKNRHIFWQKKFLKNAQFCNFGKANCPKLAKNRQKSAISPTFTLGFAKIANLWLVWRIFRAKNRWRFSQKSCSQASAKFRGFGEKSPKLATLE